MDSQELAREALLFYDSIPLLEGGRLIGQTDTLEFLQNLISVDLAKITLICSEADDVISEEELLVFTFFNMLQRNGHDFYNLLKSLDLKDKTKISKLCELSMKMINDARQRQDFSKFESVNVLKQIDDDYFLKIVESYYRFAQLLVKADGKVSQKEEEMLKRIWHLLHLDDSSENTSEKLPYEAFKVTSLALEEQTTLEDLLKELHSLVGMVNIKQDVQTLTNLLHVQKARTSQGLPSTTVNLHSVFYGPPGTGKTTIARLIGKIFKQMGFLKKGHLVETDRAGLVAGYVGQTSLKVDEVVKSALDGVLFIDEAYALIPDNSPSDYGLEAINILLKRMEDYRDRLIVIIAGYTDEMLKLMQSNPGIKSRFNRYFYFENFSPNELTQIFEIFCNKTNLFLTDGAKNKLKAIFNILHANKDKSFGNARLARNLFEKTIERQANRIAGIAPLTEEILSSITEEDIPPESQCTGYK